MKEIIKLTNAVYRYTTADESAVIKNAVDDVSFSIYEGEFVALVGHNGSGKSTLAKLLNGLLVPTTGTINVFGMNTLDASTIMEVRRNVGMVFQNPDNQMVASIVEDDIAFGAENLGIPQAEIAERVKWALESVGMYEFHDKTPYKLSGGQKQRIAIAGVLALKPRVIVLDESTAMLDPRGREDVMNTIELLRKRDNITVISITHFMDEVVSADRVIVMNHGRMAMTGTPQQIFMQDTKLIETGLEPPRVVTLANKLRQMGMNIPENIMDADALGELLCQLL